VPHLIDRRTALSAQMMKTEIVIFLSVFVDDVIEVEPEFADSHALHLEIAAALTL
jgi:hypothetical protein